ncbi:MAG: hypothetical protein Ta2E_11010 [Mycoplasmoidaceae bacterium]|nr:MAG: hypothetical protein Ta2E_11010 [Mycoplasmoidaceae bacterium]
MHDENDDEVNFYIDQRGVAREPKKKKMRTDAWFPYYHDILSLDLRDYQIFSLDQLKEMNEKMNGATTQDLNDLHFFVLWIVWNPFESKMI